jgi:copper(I)-binding protein
MTRRHLLLAALFVPPLVLAGAARAQMAMVHATDAWARATVGPAGAVYLTLTATGAPDRLVGAATDVADSADLHETANEGGVMKMRAVPALPLADGTSVTFSPGGYHIMLTGLKRPLKEGDRFALTLRFDKAPPVTVEVAVRAAGAMGMGAMGGMSGHMTMAPKSQP